MLKYCIIGTDKRSVNLRKMYREEGIVMTSYDKADVVITPIPFSKDDIKINGEIIECKELISNLKDTNKRLYTGAISENIKEKFEEAKIDYLDLMQLDSVAILNAIPTAEGAIKVAMEMTDFTIHSANVLVLGFGRIGKVLSKMLHGIGARTFCEARKEKDIALIEALGYNSVKLDELENKLEDIDIIFNTIPEKILLEKQIKLLKKTCVVIDLASSPGGIDLDKAKEYEIDVNWALALPSKAAPKSAALYLKGAIDDVESKKIIKIY